jgi:hypothetical protein
MAYKYSGRIIRAGKAWTDNDGIQHPSNWMIWDDATKAAKGLVWEDDPAPVDNRFYWGRQDDGTLIPKSLDDVNEVDDDGNPINDADGNQIVTLGLKSNAIATAKAQAGGLLESTDWMVIKASEVADYSVASEILTYRAAVRTASNTIEASITGAADLTAFMALYDSPVDSEGVPTGNAPINDWPEEV